MFIWYIIIKHFIIIENIMWHLITYDDIVEILI